MQGWEKREFPEKAQPGATSSGIEPGSARREAGSLITPPLRPEQPSSSGNPDGWRRVSSQGCDAPLLRRHLHTPPRSRHPRITEQTLTARPLCFPPSAVMAFPVDHVHDGRRALICWGYDCVLFGHASLFSATLVDLGPTTRGREGMHNAATAHDFTRDEMQMSAARVCWQRCPREGAPTPSFIDQHARHAFARVARVSCGLSTPLPHTCSDITSLSVAVFVGVSPACTVEIADATPILEEEPVGRDSVRKDGLWKTFQTDWRVTQPQASQCLCFHPRPIRPLSDDEDVGRGGSSCVFGLATHAAGIHSARLATWDVRQRVSASFPDHNPVTGKASTCPNPHVVPLPLMPSLAHQPLLPAIPRLPAGDGLSPLPSKNVDSRRYSPFEVTSNFSEASLKFYLQAISPPHEGITANRVARPAHEDISSSTSLAICPSAAVRYDTARRELGNVGLPLPATHTWAHRALNFIVLSALELESFVHWLLHRCEATPFLTELHVIGAHKCEVLNYRRRVTQGVAHEIWSNDKRISKVSSDWQRAGKLADSFGSQLDTKFLSVLEPQLVAHWLMPQFCPKIDTTGFGTPFLAVQWVEFVQGAAYKLRHNWNQKFKWTRV
ncbi:hypothetical protein PR048_024385 [Dryococelus australis]|uniref:Uncharacterized protein n=1 Tax=Dryococelus australis TaxID=614101 RepID=A0ABQ9GNG1_9NEOP|nr:hypothetical protein PR048_024385 [Dryococelus australis]